jgi:hypothetical protein
MSEGAVTLALGGFTVSVTRSCARRDLYDLRLGRALPARLRERLGERGDASGSSALWVLDAPGRHRVTIAAGSGRIVLLPRMAGSRDEQRVAATEFFQWLGETLTELERAEG